MPNLYNPYKTKLNEEELKEAITPIFEEASERVRGGYVGDGLEVDEVTFSKTSYPNHPEWGEHDDIRVWLDGKINAESVTIGFAVDYATDNGSIYNTAGAVALSFRNLVPYAELSDVDEKRDFLKDVCGVSVASLSDNEVEDMVDMINDYGDKVMEVFEEKDHALFEKITAELGIPVRELTKDDREFADTDYKRSASHIIEIGGREYFTDKGGESLSLLIDFLIKHDPELVKEHLEKVCVPEEIPEEYNDPVKEVKAEEIVTMLNDIKRYASERDNLFIVADTVSVEFPVNQSLLVSQTDGEITIKTNDPLGRPYTSKFDAESIAGIYNGRGEILYAKEPVVNNQMKKEKFYDDVRR